MKTKIIKHSSYSQLKEAKEILIILDAAEKIISYNTNAKKIFGFSDAWIGTNFFTLAQKQGWLEDNLPDDFLNANINQKSKYLKNNLTSNTGTTNHVDWFLSDIKAKNLNANFIFIGKHAGDSFSLKKKIRQTEQYYEKIIGKMPGNVWWKNKDLVYLGCNDQVLNVLGLKSVNEFKGKTDYDLWDREIAKKLELADKAVIKSAKPINLEEVIVQADGSRVVMLTNKAPLFDEKGCVTGIIGTSTDISLRKRHEKELREAKIRAEQANLTKSQFIANMSHDLRTPLNGILGMAQILDMLENNPEKKNYIEDIMNSGTRLLSLLNEILEITQIESGKLPVRLVEFELKTLVNDLHQLLNIQAQQNGIKLSVNYDKNIPDFLLGDKLRTHRILLNLINNAVKFTEKGHVNVRAKLKEKKSGETKIIFKIEDTGIGIPEDKYEVIFEQFSRLEPAYKGQYQGVGLGLGIVKQLVEEIGGNIKVKSVVGQGSTFTCTLPFEKIAKRKLTPEEEKENEKAFLTEYAKISNLKILLVEDDKTCQRVIQGFLTGTGYSIDIAGTIEKARELLNEYNYDVIFMDIGLPDGDGIDFTREIRTQLKIKTPIIATTAHVSKDRKAECLDAGMNNFIPKPVSVNNIKKALVDIFC